MPRHFDSDLRRIGADKLKPMTKIWGGNSKMIKDECIACIVAGLKDSAKSEVRRCQPASLRAQCRGAHQAHGRSYSVKCAQNRHPDFRSAPPTHLWVSRRFH